MIKRLEIIKWKNAYTSESFRGKDIADRTNMTTIRFGIERECVEVGDSFFVDIIVGNGPRIYYYRGTDKELAEETYNKIYKTHVDI